MRPFGALAVEMLSIGVPMLAGIVSGQFTQTKIEAETKADVLKKWDDDTTQLKALWPQIPAARFAETLTVFGQYTDTLHGLVLYAIENEIHHRGQGYVYLRALGIEPVPFYERA